MAEPRRFSLVDTLLLFLVLAIAAGARIWYLAACAENGTASGPLQVQDASTGRNELVHHLKTEGSFRGPAPLAAGEERTAHTAPGFPVLLMLLENAPAEMGPAERNLRWLHVLLGTLTAACYFLFARRAFQSLTVATLAGLFCGLHPFWIVSTAELEDGVVASFLLGAGLALGTRGGQVGGPLTSWLYGLTLAGLALVRAACLPFAFVAALWYLWRSQSLTRGWLLAFLAFLGFATGLVPWTAHNVRHFQEVFPVADSLYLHLWIGNNSAATGGPMSDKAMLEVLDPKSDTSFEKLAELAQPERYRRLSWLVAREVGNDPAATLQRRLRAGLYFTFGEEWFPPHSEKLARQSTGATTSPPERPAMPDWLSSSHPAFLHGSLFVMLCMGLLGWRWTAVWRHEAMPSSLALMWIPLPYLLSHAEKLSGPRLPLDGVLLTYAAFALACMLPVTGGSLRTGSMASSPGEEPSRHG